MPPSPWSKWTTPKDQYLPTRHPPAPGQKYAKFLSGGEGIIHPPLPILAGLEEEAVELLLLLLGKMYQGAKKINNMINRTHLSILIN